MLQGRCIQWLESPGLAIALLNRFRDADKRVEKNPPLSFGLLLSQIELLQQGDHLGSYSAAIVFGTPAQGVV